MLQQSTFHSAKQLAEYLQSVQDVNPVSILAQIGPRLGEFSQDKGWFNHLLSLIIQDTSKLSSHYKELLTYFNDATRALFIEAIYQQILQESNKEQHYFSRVIEEPSFDSLNLPSYFIEGYIRFDDVTQYHQKIVRIKSKIFYIDRSIKLLHELTLTENELDQCITQWTSKPLYPLVVDAFEHLLKDKNNFYCKAHPEKKPKITFEEICLKIHTFNTAYSPDSAQHITLNSQPEPHQVKEKMVNLYMTLLHSYYQTPSKIELTPQIAALQFLQSIFHDLNQFEKQNSKPSSTLMDRAKYLTAQKKKTTTTKPPMTAEPPLAPENSTAQETNNLSFYLSCTGASLIACGLLLIGYKMPQQRTSLAMTGTLIGGAFLFSHFFQK